MDRFGDKFRSVRELKGLTLEQLALETQIDAHHLLALEGSQFDELPDDDVVRGYLRACARLLDVDGEMMIQDFQRDCGSPAAPPSGGFEIVVEATPTVEEPRAVPRPRVEPLPIATATPTPAAQQSSRLSLLWIALAILGVGAAVAWWIATREPTRPDQATAPAEPTSQAVMPPLETLQPAPQPAPQPRAAAPLPQPKPEAALVPVAEPAPRPVQAAPQPAAAAPATTTAAPATRLTIDEYGVGTGVEGRQLVGATQRFHEGTRAWFWTWVRGGEPGDRIEHVWMHDGVESARVPLRIGGSSWRTHSNKQFGPGMDGNWTVEARNAAGDVLARAEFSVVP